jgi:hypothetical protein
MTMTIDNLTTLLNSMPNEALIDAVQAMDGTQLSRMPYDSAEAEWTDTEGKTWTLTGRCLTVGARAVLWTSCDEAPDADWVVIDAPADDAVAAKAHADEIAAGL